MLQENKIILPLFCSCVDFCVVRWISLDKSEKSTVITNKNISTGADIKVSKIDAD